MVVHLRSWGALCRCDIRVPNLCSWSLLVTGGVLCALARGDVVSNNAKEGEVRGRGGGAGLRERGNDTSRSTGRSGRQNAATRRNMRREERVTVEGPVKEQQRDGLSHGGGPNRGRSNTDTQNAGATPGGTRAGTADKEEGHSKAGEATGTAGTENQNGADGRACAWEAATIKGMAWPANPVATGCQGNPCSTGIRWGVSPAAQMGCLRNRSGSPSGADQP